MRSITGGPGAAAFGAHKLVGYGTALFIGDAVTRVASGTKKTPAISAAITPGTTPMFGVNLVWGAASTATDHLVIPGNFQVFETQSNGTPVAADLNKNANIALGAGSATLKISGHVEDHASVQTTNTLDLHIVGIWNAPDNDFGQYAKLEVIFNRNQLTDQVAGI